MTVEQAKNDAYWTAVRVYIWHRYRKTVIAIGIGLVAVTAGTIYYVMKYREKKRQEQSSKKGAQAGSKGERSVSKSAGKRPSDFSTSVRSSRSRRDSSMDTSQHGGDSMSVSISRRKPRTKVWSLDEILEDAPVTEKKHKSQQKYETKAKSTDVKRKSTEEKKPKRTWRFPFWW